MATPIRIGIQSGHQNITSNCNLNLRGGTGAPGEIIWTPKVRDAIAPKLIARGFQVFLFDGNANCQTQANQDFDLFLALHYDADVYGTGGGFADFPDPSVDAVNARSKQLCDKINQVYFTETGIAYHPERSNGNTKFYYMWQALTAKTPCVLLECGTNNRDNLPNRVEEVATAIAKAICACFNVNYDNPPTPTPATDSDPDSIGADAKLAQIKALLYGGDAWWNNLWRVKEMMKVLPK